MKRLDVSGLLCTNQECQTEKFEQKNAELEDFALQILSDCKELDEIVNSLENCGYCSTMLLNLINDLMDLAKLEKMKFSLNKSFFDLTKTIRGAFGTLSYFGKQKEIEPTLKIEDKMLPYFNNLFGDETRFTQIFLNFLSNAFKFTPQKGSISVEIKPIEDENGFLQKIDNEEEKETRKKDALIKMMHRDSNSFDFPTVKSTDAQVLFDQYYVSF